MLAEYRSHKIVQAGKILQIDVQDNGSVKLTCEQSDGSVNNIHVDKSVVSRYMPVIGDYLVSYPGSDNYLSISPKAAFEEGYTKI